MFQSTRVRGRRCLSVIGSLLIVAGLLPASSAIVLANSVAQSLPFSQDWTDTTLITTTNDWSGVPGIIGFFGQDITTATGTDPQTLLGVSAVANDVDLIANQTSPNTLTQGGVAEFHIADPSIALNGSGTADAPHILIHITTSGLENINVAYNLRDLDGSADDVVQPVALQFRVGSTGLFTNVPSGFVADATTGGTATQVTAVSAALPATVNDQALVQVRVMTTNAAGSDEWVGIDDISITASTVDPAPTVTSSPPDGATDVPINTTPTLTFSEEVALDAAGVSLSCTTQGTKSFGLAGGPSVFTLTTTAFLNGDHCTLGVEATAVADSDTNDPPDNLAADFSASFDIVAAVTSPIVINEVDYDQVAGDTAEYVELKNTGTSGVNLDTYSVLLVNGTGGGATIYDTVDLPGVILAAGDYFVVCANAETVANCDLDDAPNTDFIQNGAPDAVALRLGSAIVDSVSYEGNTGAPYTEGTGTSAADSNADGGIGLSRCSDGTDTNNNDADFLLRPITPGARNSCPGEDVAPDVSTTFPQDGATDVDVAANLTVTFTEAVNVVDPWFSLTCNELPKTATSSGGPTTFTIDPDTDFADGDVCTLTIIAAQVTDQDAIDPPDNMEVNFAVGFTAQDVCLDTFTPIYTIQGSGTATPIPGPVTTQGVVTGAFDNTGGIGGFYIQDPAGDGDPATSDGIFVFTNNANTVSAGELVRVSGTAQERFNQTAITAGGTPPTPIPAGNVVVCGEADAPDPVEVTMPFEFLGFQERYEGMLVTFPQPLVISEFFNYDQFGEIVLALPLAGEARPFSGTALDEPGADANARTLANQLRRITLDDNQGGSNPAVLRHPNGEPFSLANRFRGGDTVANATGVLGFDFSLYRIFPTSPADYTEVNPRPPVRDDVGGTLTAAAMNTLNFFITPDYPNTPPNPLDNKCGGNGNLECRGHDFDQPAEFDRQRDKLLEALAGLDADIIGLNELENSPGVDTLTDPNGIVAGLNAMPGVGPYAAIETGVIGTDAIRVGLIYRSDVVAPVGDFKVLNSSVDPRFIDTRSRPVLAQAFEDLATGARITVAVNHLKSKGSACTGTAAPPLPDPDTGDGQGNCPLTRELAAQALVDWLATDPTGSGDRDYLILGDLNSYAREDPIDAIKAGPDDVAGTADDYTNLIESYLGEEAYSFVFDGQSGYLDHALASPTLVGQVTGATEWHINADEPDVVDYDTSFKPPSQEALYEDNPYRSSDHDPVIVGLDLLNYEFSGFEGPVDNPPVLNEVKAGQGVPVKFQLADGLGLDVLFGMPSATQFTCEGGGATDPVEATTSGASGLQLDPVTGVYTYVWKTDKLWVNQCRTFEITFDDGAYRQALFSLK